MNAHECDLCDTKELFCEIVEGGIFYLIVTLSLLSCRARSEGRSRSATLSPSGTSSTCYGSEVHEARLCGLAPVDRAKPLRALASHFQPTHFPFTPFSILSFFQPTSRPVHAKSSRHGMLPIANTLFSIDINPILENPEIL